jgi:hypothetical protein
MTQRTFLGVVDRVTARSGEASAIGWIRPLCELASDAEPRTIERPLEEFPNRGLVAWWDAPPHLREDTFWIFEMRPSPTFSATAPRHAQYNAFAMSEALEVIDLRSVAEDEDQGRVLLVEAGLSLPHRPTSRVWIRLKDNEWFGPARLIDRNGAWVLAADLVDEPLRIVAMSKPRASIRVVHDGTREFLDPAARPDRFLHLLDWAPDLVILKRLLRRLRDVDAEYAAQLGTTAKAIDRIVEKLAIAGSTAELELDRRRLKRVKRFVPLLRDNADRAKDVVDALLAIEPVRAALEEQRAQILRDVRREAIETIARETADAVGERNSVRSEVGALTEHALVLRREVGQLQERVDRRVKQFETELRQRLEQMAVAPETFFSELAIFNALARRSNQNVEMHQDAQCSVVVIGDAAAPLATVSADELALESRATMADLEARFAGSGLPDVLAVDLHATFVSGAVPVLLGARAFDALTVYASRVCGARVFWIPATSAMIAPGDLLGNVTAATGTDRSECASLAEFLRQAADETSMQLVVVDNANVAPMETYLAPLLALYAEAWHSGKRRQLRIQIDAVRAMRLSWPRNVLLALIASEGLATFPAVHDLWANAVILDGASFVTRSDEKQRWRHPDDALDMAWASEFVSTAVWHALKLRGRNASLEGAATLWKGTSARFALASDSHEITARLFAAAVSLGASSEATSGLVARGLLPYCRTQLEDYFTWLLESRLVAGEASNLAGSIGRLLS